MSTPTLLALGTVCLLAGSVVAAPGDPAAPPTIKSFGAPFPTFGSVERLDPALDKLIPPEAKLEKLAEGFDWTEGPVWVKNGKYLLFSDIPPNTIYKWREGKGTTVYLKPAGYSGNRTDMKEPGTNGLTVDKKGGLVMCQHGNRRLARLPSVASPQGKQQVVCDKYDGKRLNSPNDLVIHSSGDIFFTDPPYGLAKQVDDPEKEIPFQGVYRVNPKGVVTLLHDKLERPNGIGLGPDEKTLYVANSHGPRMIWMAFDVEPTRNVANGRIFFDATPLGGKPNRKGGPDGLKVDKEGNLFATGPGGVLVFSKEGKHLGTILTGEATANVAFGDDGSTLYIAADMYLARIKTGTRGLGF